MASKYSDEEWFEIITECRTSGIPQRHWCSEHQISMSAYYSNMKHLVQKGYSIPDSVTVHTNNRQEIVEITGTLPEKKGAAESSPFIDGHSNETAVRLVFKGIPIELTNTASGNLLVNILTALEEVC